MSIEFAVERLYLTGWRPDDNEIDFLENLPVPSIAAVQRAFSRAGMQLELKQNLMFNCVCASWTDAAAGRSGTAIGSTQHEAAVWALAQLREHLHRPPVVETKPSETSRRTVLELEDSRSGSMPLTSTSR